MKASWNRVVKTRSVSLNPGSGRLSNRFTHAALMAIRFEIGAASAVSDTHRWSAVSPYVSAAAAPNRCLKASAV